MCSVEWRCSGLCAGQILKICNYLRIFQSSFRYISHSLWPYVIYPKNQQALTAFPDLFLSVSIASTLSTRSYFFATDKAEIHNYTKGNHSKRQFNLIKIYINCLSIFFCPVFLSFQLNLSHNGFSLIYTVSIDMTCQSIKPDWQVLLLTHIKL